MYKNKKIGLIILILIFTISLSPIFGEENTINTWYVSQNQINGNGTQENPYNNIESAINSANENNTIIINNGTYTGVENTKLNISTNGLKIKGEDAVIDFEKTNNTILIRGENIKIEGISFKNSQNTAITTYSQDLEIKNSNFINNNGEYGGAIYNRGNLKIINSTFINNSGFYGGAIYNRINLKIEESYFTNNTGKLYGGVIYNQNQMTINNTKFTNNQVTGYGGVIYNNKILNISNSEFTDNNANGFGYGGSIHNSGTINIINTKFNNNTAYYGGTIDNDENLTLINTNITNSKATQSAGAIDNGGNLEILNSNFINNTAGYNAHGGSIFNRGTLKITKTNFITNSANGNGGAIYIDRGGLELNKTNIINNTGKIGSGIYSHNSNNTIINSQILENTIYLNNSESLIKYNYIKEIQLENSNYTIKDNIIQDTCENLSETYLTLELNLNNNTININEILYFNTSFKSFNKTSNMSSNIEDELFDLIPEITSTNGEIELINKNTTDSYYSIKPTHTGTSTIKARYGNLNTEKTFNITSNNKTIQIQINNLIKEYNSSKNLDGKILDENNNALTGFPIEITLIRLTNNLNKTYKLNSDYNGKFSLKINLAEGTYKGIIKFNTININGENYEAYETSIIISIVKNTLKNTTPTYILSSKYNESFNSHKSFKGILKDIDNNPLAGQTLNINILRVSSGANKSYKTVSNYNGEFNLDINLAIGEYIVYCSYEGINNYTSSYFRNTLTVY